MKQIGSFWKKVSKAGRDYWHGTIRDEKVWMFANTKKKNECHGEGGGT